MLPIILSVQNQMKKQPQEQPSTPQKNQDPQIQNFNPDKLNFQDLIRKKKQGEALSKKEIEFWVQGVTLKQIPDYQISALLMAIYFRGMNVEERSYLTRAMALSGDSLSFPSIQAKKADKHSTGGVGDKTSFIISPLMVALGLVNPMISGRGLGHTGGTVDKLESIPGFRTDLSFEEMHKSIEQVGSFIIGQTAEIAPADKHIYALRDVTQTVDEISLITASILSKKFAENLDILTLDVKYGSGAFMQKIEKSLNLAKSLVNTANKGGVNCNAVLTRMDYPLGEFSGNALEIYESLQILTPGTEYTKIVQEKIKFNDSLPGHIQIGDQNHPETTKELLVYITFGLLLNTVILSGLSPQDAFESLQKTWVSGSGLKKFEDMLKQQGGNLENFNKNAEKILENFKNNNNIFEFKAPYKGKIKSINGEQLGYILVDLGAGRRVKTDIVHGDVSMQWVGGIGQTFEKEDILCRFYHPEGSKMFEKINIQGLLEDAIEFTEDLSYEDTQPFIYQTVKPEIE